MFLIGTDNKGHLSTCNKSQVIFQLRLSQKLEIDEFKIVDKYFKFILSVFIIFKALLQ